LLKASANHVACSWVTAMVLLVGDSCGVCS